jgi:CheY-like chemotaxis protein
VLLIDDDDDTRALLRLVLEGAGHVVLDASGGAEGLRVALAERPDCVIMDVGLPDLGGYEVASAIRAADPGRVIGLAALTGYGGDEERARSRRAGFDVHLVKPVEPSLVVATVNQLATQRR